MEEYIIEDQEHLEALVESWKEALKLQPWTITAEIVRYWDFNVEGRVGYISWTVANRTAHMKLLDGNDHPPDTVTPNDMEVAVVHELLHLVFHFVEFDADSMEAILFEQAVEATAQALVAVKRKKLATGGYIRGTADPSCRTVTGTMEGVRFEGIEQVFKVNFRGDERPREAKVLSATNCRTCRNDHAKPGRDADACPNCNLGDRYQEAAPAVERTCRTCIHQSPGFGEYQCTICVTENGIPDKWEPKEG